jgi:hypothetical protein
LAHFRGVEISQLLQEVERDLGHHLDLAAPVPLEDPVGLADETGVRPGGQPFGGLPAGLLVDLDRDFPDGPVLVATPVQTRAPPLRLPV